MRRWIRNKLILDHTDNAVDEEDHAEEKDDCDEEGGAQKVRFGLKGWRDHAAVAVAAAQLRGALSPHIHIARVREGGWGRKRGGPQQSPRGWRAFGAEKRAIAHSFTGRTNTLTSHYICLSGGRRERKSDGRFFFSLSLFFADKESEGTAAPPTMLSLTVNVGLPCTTGV